jgi:hypothetical protein
LAGGGVVVARVDFASAESPLRLSSGPEATAGAAGTLANHGGVLCRALECDLRSDAVDAVSLRSPQGPAEFGACLTDGALCLCRGCAEAIRPPAYVAAVLGMTAR